MKAPAPPISNTPNMKTNYKILLAHGGGGKLTRDLIQKVMLTHFDSPILSPLKDSAVFELEGQRFAFTTDSYVVKPLFFPGGNIGKLAVAGTINDLAVVGAKPLYLSCGLIIEEGLDLGLLEKVLESMSENEQQAGVQIVTGDTKVVEKKGADQLFINTAGIGIITPDRCLDDSGLQVGDKVLINGGIGEHEAAIISSREGFDFESEIISDCAPLNDLIQNILATSRKVKWMRDPTRGGLAATLNELVEGKSFGIRLQETQIPVKDEVKGICELLGFDPLYMANEGKVVVIVGTDDVIRVLETMKSHPLGKDSCIIGEIIADPKGRVVMQTEIGGHRIVDMPLGEMLPRIC
jgi:hydrogenase expression/formation protein HypE